MLLGATLTGCGKERIPPPAAPAPALAGPTDAIPGELDLAVRIDLGRIRSVLGSAAFEKLRQSSMGSAPKGDDETARLLADAMARSKAVWVAVRPGPRAELTDSVTVLSGDFAKLDPRSYASDPAWGPPLDLGAGWRRWDRAKPKARSSPARIYARTDDVLVLVTEAPLDSVERRLEQGVDDAHVEPAEEGVFSLDARAPALRAWLSDRWPTASRLLAQCERVRLHADLDAVGLRGELELHLSGAGPARDTAEALGGMARALVESGGLAAKVAGGLRVEAVGSRVVVRVSLPPEVLAAALGCVDGGSCE